MKMKKKGMTIPLAFITPGLLVYSIFVIIPVMISIYYSFFKWNGVNEMKFILFDNFITLFQDEVFFMSFKNLGIFLSVTLVVQFFLGLAMALYIGFEMKMYNTFKVVFFFPVVVSQVIVALMFCLLFNYNFGPVNQILKLIGLGKYVKDWLGEKNVVMWIISLVNAWQYAGTTMLFLLSGINAISADVFDACALDGASRRKMITSVILPIIKPQIRVSLLLMAFGVINDFAIVYNMTMGGPMHASEVPATYMYKQAFANYSYGKAMAISTIILLSGILFVVVFNIIMGEKKERA